MIEDNEFKARTVWSKFLSYERTDAIFGETWYAGVFCVREVSGYAVWYRRWLKDDNDEAVAANGDYLLRFYSPTARDEAIEFAVLATTNHRDDEPDLLRILDIAATKAQRIEVAKSVAPPF